MSAPAPLGSVEMTAVLWHIEVSHFNEKARWALDYKGIAHERRVPLPGVHAPVVLWLTRGTHRRLPLLEIDGRRIGDSTAIIAAVEAHQPEPPLYPDDPVERRRALELEDFFDEQLAPQLRRLVWHHTLDDADAVIESVMPNAHRARKRAMRTLVPFARPLVRRDYAIDEAGAADAIVKVRAAMDRVERERRPSGYLVGERFSVADLTAAALFTPLLAPPGRQHQPPTLPPPLLELREELTAREGGAWVFDMYARHRGVSAEVARAR